MKEKKTKLMINGYYYPLADKVNKKIFFIKPIEACRKIFFFAEKKSENSKQIFTVFVVVVVGGGKRFLKCFFFRSFL